jgi:hypothetical protein
VLLSSGLLVPKAYAAGVPVVEGYNVNGSTSTSSLSINKPSGVVSGDLLLLLHVSTSYGGNTKSGWNRILAYSSGTRRLTAYTRMSDGTEGSSESIATTLGTEVSAYYIRISGAEDNDGLHVVGTPNVSSLTSTTTANEETTSVDDCLIIAHFGKYPTIFSSTTVPHTINSGTGWTVEATHAYVSNGNGTSISFTSKDLASAGGTGNLTMKAQSNSNDGAIVMYAIAPGETRNRIILT